MNTSLRIGAGASLLVAVGLLTGAGEAKVKVTISEMHACCGGCVKAIEKAATSVEGIEAKAQQEEGEEGEGMVELTAANYETIQKAIDEIAKAGFSGDLDSDKVKFPTAKSPEGKVQKLEIAHIHNCCPVCTKYIKETLHSVDGVKSDTVKPKEVSFTVEGDFEAKQVIEALTKAGFYPEVK
jgi:periplasmic mercuric ion binding protein